MPLTPSTLPAVTAITVGTAAFAITLPDRGGDPKLGVLLLQRSGGTDTVYWSMDSSVTTSTGVLISKGDPGTTSPYLIPADVFDTTKTIYLIATASSQTVDVVII